MRKEFPDKDIGVFLCGPKGIGDQLKAMCSQLNPQAKARYQSKKDDGPSEPRFIFHQETF